MARDGTKSDSGRPIRFGLSARLLLLTIFFVMLSEVFIYAPSIGRYRHSFLNERIAAAHLASLAVVVPEDGRVDARLRSELLDHAGVLGISLRRPGRKELILSGEMPHKVDANFNVDHGKFFMLIMEAFRTLYYGGDRILRVSGTSPKEQEVTVEIILSEKPL